MKNSEYLSPNRIIRSNYNGVATDGKSTLREGVLLNCAHKRLNVNSQAKKELNEAELVINKSPTISSPSTSRSKSKTPIINACYTPSSLFRSANAFSTPSSVRSGKIMSSKLRLLNPSVKKDDTEDRLKVAVRVRPLNAKECLLASVTNIVRVDGNEITVLVGSSADASSGVSHSFVYDEVFSSCDPESLNYSNQQEVFFKTAHPLITRAFEGYNACLFAYGQTGSGKSYSMMGIDAFDSFDIQENVELNLDAGIIPRFCHDLFQCIQNGRNKFHTEVEVSYFEIYNEKIHDLLCVSQDMENSLNGKILGGTPISKKPLKVREHPIWGPYVVDLSIHPVDSFEALRNWLIVGNSQRATAATGLNDKSSRSHSIFNIMLKIRNSELPDTDIYDDNKLQQTRRSKISLVDLAGSERISGSNGERIREGVHINKSLLTLGKVISALSDDRNSNCSVFVPYRESVLTWLLRLLLSIREKIPRESIETFQDLLQKARDVEMHIQESKEPKTKLTDDEKSLVRCSFCRKKNHTSETCYKRIEADRKRNPTTKQTTLNCFGCGLAGYYRSNCPKCNQQDPTNSPQKIDFNSIHTTLVGRDVPTVQINISGLNGEAYFDTAARTSVAGYTLFKKLKEKGNDFQEVSAEIILADGISRQEKVYSTIVGVLIGKRFKRIRFICLPKAQENRTLIGIDFLEQAGIVLDLAQRTWYFKDDPGTIFEFKLNKPNLAKPINLIQANIAESNPVDNFLTWFENSNNNPTNGSFTPNNSDNSSIYDYSPGGINKIFEGSIPEGLQTDVYDWDLFPPLKSKQN